MKLHYKIKGEGEPVILLHGLFGSLDNLGSLSRALSEDYEVISVDMRNHGRSPHAASMKYDELAADVIELMDALEIKKAYLFGHSMGGKTAMQVALNYPERVKKLCIADIAPVAYSHHHKDILEGMNHVAEHSPDNRKDVIELLRPFESEEAILTFIATNWRKDKAGKWGWRLNLDAITHDHMSIMAAITGNPYQGPVMFVRGGDSHYLLPEYSDYILELFPNAKVRTIEGTGHWLHAEKPDMFARIVKRFLTPS